LDNAWITWVLTADCYSSTIKKYIFIVITGLNNNSITILGSINRILDIFEIRRPIVINSDYFPLTCEKRQQTYKYTNKLFHPKVRPPKKVLIWKIFYYKECVNSIKKSDIRSFVLLSSFPRNR